MTNTKIHGTHCERTAFVYVRQSTWLQVSENRESTERQYNLRERAIELGWPESRVEVIDEDQGRSGSTATFRTGFQRLAAEVGLGKVGIVLMLEASRLARNNSDWYRLIEICGISGTLIADEGAVYNPREPNDRLLLGVKGTLSGGGTFHAADAAIRIGLSILFRSVDQSKPGIYGVRADGSGEARRLLELTDGEFPSSVSSDGKRLAIWAAGKIWIAPLQSDGRDVSVGKPVLFLQTRFNPTVPGRMAPVFSPDGRWLAYCSNESEQLEVYVIPFPGPGGKWRISTVGGEFPVWSRNGRELFFQDLESHRMMATTYSASGGSFSAATPRTWSDTRLLELGRYHIRNHVDDQQRANFWSGWTSL